MLLSFSLILLSGTILGELCRKCKLPPLLGMLFSGVILGPYALNLIAPSILTISADVRKIALVIILIRAGLSLDTEGLKRNGRSALLMCFVPASLELIGSILLGPPLLGLSIKEAALLGAVLAAVSPAVVVPRMIRLTEEGYGTAKGIPQLILAGASVDDVYVIVLFTTFLNMLTGDSISALSFVNIPVSVVLGIALGILSGLLFAFIFSKLHIRDTQKLILLLCFCLLLCAAESSLHTPITFSSLIAVMFLGVGLQRKKQIVASRLSVRFNKLWVCAEVFLFVLVGASVNLESLRTVGLSALLVIAGSLLFRMCGVFLCMLGTPLSCKERLFTMLAYCPKATVQAAIGGLALDAGLPCGAVVLSAAVLAIVLTAPLGAFAIDATYKKLLKKE